MTLLLLTNKKVKRSMRSVIEINNLEKENVSLLRGIPHIFNNPRKRSCLT